MKALSLTQPWATLVAIGAKRIETRSWSTRYRGPLAIHAAKGFPRDARDFAGSRFVNYFLVTAGYATGDKYAGLPIGSIIATCQLVDCLPMEAVACLSGVFDDHPELDTEQERSFGDFSPGRWAWVLEDVKQCEPIPAKGALGLWEWESLTQRVLAERKTECRA
jgi:activating signal cointegrator 1